MIRLFCSFDSSIGRHHLEDYVREVRIDVRTLDASGQEVIVGKIAATHVLWADAEVDGESLFDICEYDSPELQEVYRTLTNKKGKIRVDLQTFEVVDHVIFLHRIVLHPDLAFYQQGILDSAISLFGEAALTVMPKDVGDFPESELAELDFCKIAGEQLIFRHSAFKSPFTEKYPRGMEIDFVGTAEQQAWIERQWATAKATEGRIVPKGTME